MPFDEILIELLEKTNINDFIDSAHVNCCPFCKASQFYTSKKNYVCACCDACGDVFSYLMDVKCNSLDESVTKVKHHLEAQSKRQ